MKHYHQEKYLLIEAQSIHEQDLIIFTKETCRVKYIDSSISYGGQAFYTSYKKNNITVPVDRVDDEIGRRSFKGPLLLKLDTHGFEVPIIKGAQNISNTQAINKVEYKHTRICCLPLH